MPQRHRPAYPAEFRERLVELVRSGRSPEDLAREFEPSAQAIRNWVAQADRDRGARSDGLTTAEREELRRLRRENKQLKIEKDTLKKPPPGSRRRPIRFRPRIRIRESASSTSMPALEARTGRRASTATFARRTRCVWAQSVSHA
jgi:transposase